MAAWNSGSESNEETSAIITSARMNDVISDSDFLQVTKLLDVDDCYELYQALNMSYRDIRNAEIDAPCDAVDIKASSVLAAWRRQNGNEATRQALLNGLEKCRNIEAKDNLEDIWNGRACNKRSETDYYDAIKPLGSEEFPRLYQVLRLSKAFLGLSTREVEKAKRRVESQDLHQKEMSVIRWWIKTNGKKATLEILLEAVQSCSSIATAMQTTKGTCDFDFASVRRQLKNEYLETRGKLPLLPGMPDEFARMEDLFVDLEIIKEDKQPSVVVPNKLESYGELVCIRRESVQGETEENVLVKRILVRGKPGVGKSSTVSKLAFDWACGNQDSRISKFQLLFAITIHEIDAHTDLIGVIQDQLLPEVSRQSLKDYLQSNASSVVILFDGYDEASKHFHQSRDIKNVLCSKWLAEACVVVTTRPNQVGKFAQNYGPYLQVEILGFSDYERKRLYVERFMKSKKSHEFLYNLYKSSLEELASIPIILSMLCLLWVDKQKLPSTVTALYKTVITHLAKHSYSKTATDDLDMACVQHRIDSVLNQIGEVAFEGLFEDRLVFSSHKFKPKNLEEGCTLGVVTKEKKRSGLTVTYNVTFLHKTFQECCAAHFWVGLIENEEEKFSTYLKRVNNDNVFEMEYLLRFACGLSLKAAEIILPHVVHVLCQHRRMKDYMGDVKILYDNPCQQLGIFLLHEAESNNAEVGQCIELHKHIKPLIKTMKIDSSSWEAGEFQEILTSYKSSQQSNIANKSDGHLWLDDVENVYWEWDDDDNDEDDDDDDDDRLRCAIEFVCAMSRISTLIIIIGKWCERKRENIIELLSSETRSLSELHLIDVECTYHLWLNETGQ